MSSQDLTVGSIGKHIKNIAVPSMVGSIFLTLYNVVDTIWAGKMGINVSEIFASHEGDIWGALIAFLQASGNSKALTALSVTFPVFLIILALSIGVMSGTLALIGNALGSKDKHASSTYLVQAFLYAVMASAIMFLIIPIFPYIMNLMKLHDETVRSFATQYLNTIIYGGIFFSAGMVANAGLISRGDSKTQRNVSIATFFLNIILDPIFMLGFGPIPAMGIAGIALATIISQALAFVVYMIKLHKYKAFEGLTADSWKPHWKTLGQIAAQSLPQTLNMGIIAFLLALVNVYALKFGGTTAAAAYGVSLRIEQIALIPSMGVRTALASIGSQNNGAKKIDRMRHTYKIALVIALGLLIFIMLPLSLIFPRQALSIFTQDPAVLDVGVSYLKVCFFTFYAYMLYSLSGAVFQAIKKPYWIMIMTLIRNCIFPFITFPMLSAKFGLQGVWYGIFINNWIIAIASFILYLILMRKRDNEVRLNPNID